jgi:hypothetical protein
MGIIYWGKIIICKFKLVYSKKHKNTLDKIKNIEIRE